ncbi:acyl-CoA dehydrogenase family protein [Actinocrispum wychmicini]|uniref:Acyl-[acyl-carrier-protein] dehydrogenase MbtN n=1 Tax=Actinocrispum wychmicini TaxID=1213861 RepID=A0A4R2JP58_9PSEU|nr:acyl-CoA dehydrogenase family protein [Actinocrispum wychmicini]TCO61174.1 acyl-CoA dehydrogenase/long-chain-acyl-CoA dehydrogenase [Actinocrispum wychmicini]
MVTRAIFESEHELFRASARSFVAREILPRLADWEEAGVVDRDLWRRAGKVGLLGMHVDKEYGGGGVDDYRFQVVWNEELAYAGALSPAFNLHSEVVGGFLDRLSTPEQKSRWLPDFCTGECVGTIAITEPEAGSDVSAIRTTARRDGDCYLLNGQKAFVTHGSVADYILVLARLGADDDRPAGGPASAVLLLVRPTMAGVVIGRREAKIGVRSLDTVEVFLRDVRVPVGHRLGEEGLGFLYLLDNLPRERLSISVSALALAERVFAETVAHTRGRRAFGGSLVDLQHVRFTLAEMSTELTVARAFTDQCIMRHNDGALSTEDASMAKWWNTELCGRVTDRCLQLHGAQGYSRDSVIGRAYVDSRVQRIYGGSTEVMKEIIGQSI